MARILQAVGMMKKLLALLIIGGLICSNLAAGTASLPKIKVAKDGFPTGQDTAEGAACDLARSYIHCDSASFQKICVQPYGTGQSRKAYQNYLLDTISHLRSEVAKKPAERAVPQAIGKVYASRHLSDKNAVPYAQQKFGFQDIAFVDVGLIAGKKDKIISRTLVIKDKDGKWYAQPNASASGIPGGDPTREQTPRNDFREVYQIQK
jgi:hypothetical protein